jgi:hypothetical protein
MTRTTITLADDLAELVDDKPVGGEPPRAPCSDVGSAEFLRESPWAAIVDDSDAPPEGGRREVLVREYPDAIDCYQS